MSPRTVSDEQLWGSPPRVLRLPPGMVWRAHDHAGLGHLLARGALRYLCHRMPIAERYGWPVRQRCADCVAALEGTAPIAD